MQLKIENVCKVYKDKKAVDHVSFKMGNGVYGLLGVNGAGKTTLMKMLCGLLEADKGKIMVDGKDINELGSNYCDNLGYLPQEFGYYPEFTAKEYLHYIASIKGVSRQKIRNRVNEVLRIVSLEEVENKKIRAYSGGMKRRVGIAQAILNEPQILILDEPTVGLDPKERNRFRQLLSELAEDRIILLSTHIVSDVEAIADEILLMKEGKLIAKGRTQELLAVLEGKVWNCTVSTKESIKIQQQFVVSNMKGNNKDMELRIISEEKPMVGAVNMEPILEDLFLYCFNETGGAP